jgi:UDP-2-acetamido-2,6-beta-L-arabino-hexul-4-ose reductase
MRRSVLRSLTTHRDTRGRVVEIFRDPRERAGRGRQVFVTTANPGCVKGNHYHVRKTESFYVVTGRMLMRLRDRWTGRTEDFLLDGESAQVIEVAPGVTHALRNEGPGELIVLVCVDEIFNPADPDTHSDIVLEATAR